MLLLRDLMKFISKPEKSTWQWGRGPGEEGKVAGGSWKCPAHLRGSYLAMGKGARGGREGGRGLLEVSSPLEGVQTYTQSASPHPTPVSDPRLLGALGGFQICAS